MRVGALLSLRKRAAVGAFWLLLALVAACRSPAAETDASTVDAGTDATAVLVDADATSEDASDTQATDVAALDLVDTGPPIGCPPDPTPTWAGMSVQTSPFQGAPVPGDDCAWPGWASPPAQAAADWTRVTADLGLNDVGRVDLCLIWQDVTGDGQEDLVTLLQPTTSIAPRTLLIAAGGANGQLTVKTYATNLHANPSDCGVADLDQNGTLELVVTTNIGVTILSLDAAAPGGDVTAQFGAFNKSPSRTVTPMDFDSDGDVDLYITDAVEFTSAFQCIAADDDYWMCCVPPFDLTCMKAKKGQADLHSCCDVKAMTGTQYLFRNDGGKFVDVSQAQAFKTGFMETVSPFDLDRDGALDFFGGEDFGEHGWYRRENGGYAYHGTDWGLRPYAHLMGSVVADFDLDHNVELVIADIGADTIYSAGAQGFKDASKQWGLWTLTRNTVTWAELAVDLDNDGWLDLMTTTSLRALDDKMHEAANKDPSAFSPGFSMVHHNLGKTFLGQQLPWSEPMNSEFNPPTVAALGDYDQDHDLDLFILEPGSKLVVWRNNTPPGAHWLVVKPVGPHGPVLNALVQVWSQGHVLERWIQTSTGFGAHQQGIAQFGLGNVASLDLVRIWWPNGVVTDSVQPAVDQVLTFTQPGK